MGGKSTVLSGEREKALREELISRMWDCHGYQGKEKFGQLCQMLEGSGWVMRKGHLIWFDHSDIFKDLEEGSFSRGSGLEESNKDGEEIEAIIILRYLFCKNQRDFITSWRDVIFERIFLLVQK